MIRRLGAFSAVLLFVSGFLFAQDWSAQPTYGTADLSSGFAPDPYIVEMVAGGNIDLSATLGYVGFVANAPDFDLIFTAGGLLPLVIRAESDADTTLLVNAPDGSWHLNDDYDGLDPAIIFEDPQSGMYNIWVGTYSSSTANARLLISEMSSW